MGNHNLYFFTFATIIIYLEHERRIANDTGRCQRANAKGY